MKDYISVIIPIYNEEKYIINCVESLLLQSYPKEKMEWIFIDGNSIDKTKLILNEYKEKYKNLIKIYDRMLKNIYIVFLYTECKIYIIGVENVQVCR